MEAPDRPRVGEPYELAGKRLLFTDWHHVRPGGFGWYDDHGTNRYVNGSAGPLDLRLRGHDTPMGIRLVAQPAERHGRLFEPDAPWEKGGGFSSGTLIKEDGKFRLWGTSLAPSEQAGAASDSLFSYLESGDGLAWTRPKLGLFEWRGGRDNNILGAKGGTVFRDPPAPASERYKWVSVDSIPKELFLSFRKRRPASTEPQAYSKILNYATCINGAVSADGLRWAPLPEPIVVETSDTQVVAYYDEWLRQYVMYTRNWMIGRRSRTVPDEQAIDWARSARRSIGRSESRDFRNFPVSEVVFEPGPDMLPSDTLYANSKTTVPGAPDHHLMFPTIWHQADDTTSVGLASSHDGRLWHFVPGSPIFDTAPFGEWDGGCLFAHPNLVELADGRWVLPYTASNFPHKYARGQWKLAAGYAVWPKGRLVALETVERGEFATLGLIPPGRKLYLNTLTARAGKVLVEVTDLDRKPLPGRTFDDAIPVVGDHVRAAVHWKGQEDLGHREGTGVILRFRLERAKIFSLEFA